MRPLVIYFSGKVQQEQETLHLLEAHVSNLCRGYDASPKVCGFLLEDSVALVCIHPPAVCDLLLSSPFVPLPNGLEGICKPAAAHASNLVDVALLDTHALTAADFDALLSALTTTYAAHIHRVFQAKSRAVVAFATQDAANVGVHFVHVYCMQHRHDVHALSFAVLDLEAIRASPAVIHGPALPGGRAGRVEAEQVNAALAPCPGGGLEGSRCPIVLAVSPCHLAGAHDAQSALVLTPCDQDVASLQALRGVDVAPGVAVAFSAPAGPPGPPGPPGLQLKPSGGGVGGGDRSRAPSLPTPMASSALLIWDTRYCTVPTQSLQASAALVSNRLQSLLPGALVGQDPKAFVAKHVAIVDSSHPEHSLPSLGDFVVTPSGSAQEAEGIARGLIEGHVSSHGSRSVVVLASLVDFILAVTRPYLPSLEASLLAVPAPLSDAQRVQSLAVPSFAWAPLVLDGLPLPAPDWRPSLPSLGFDLSAAASAPTAAGTPTASAAARGDADTSSSHPLFGGAAGGADKAFLDAPAASPPLGGLYTRTPLDTSSAFLPGPPVGGGSGSPSPAHAFLAMRSRSSSHAPAALAVDSLPSFESEHRLELWTYTLALLFEKLLAWGPDEAEAAALRLPPGLDYLRGESLADYDHSPEARCAVRITIDTAVGGYSLALRGRSAAMLAKRAQRLAALIEQVQATREMFQLVDWTPAHRTALLGSEVLKQQEKNCGASAYLSVSGTQQTLVEVVALTASHGQALSTFLHGLRPEAVSVRLHRALASQAMHGGLGGQLHRSYACHVQLLGGGASADEDGGGGEATLQAFGFGPTLLSQALAYLPVHGDYAVHVAHALGGGSAATPSPAGEAAAYASTSSGLSLHDLSLGGLHTAHGSGGGEGSAASQVPSLRGAGGGGGGAGLGLGLGLEGREVICKIHRGTYSFADREAGIFFFAFESHFRDYLERVYAVVVEDSDFSLKASHPPHSAHPNKGLPSGSSASSASGGISPAGDAFGYAAGPSSSSSLSFPSRGTASDGGDASLASSSAAGQGADLSSKNIVLKISFYGNHMKNVSAARSYLEQLNTTSLARIQLFFPQVSSKKYREIYTRKATQCTYLNSLRIRDLHEAAASGQAAGDATAAAAAAAAAVSAPVDPLQARAFVNIRVKPPMHNHGIRRMGLPADVTVTICGSVLCEANIALMKELEEQFNAIASDYLVAEVRIPYSHPMKRNLTIKALREELIRTFQLVALKWEEGSRATGSVGTAKIWAASQESLAALLAEIKAAEAELERAGLYAQPAPLEASGGGAGMSSAAATAAPGTASSGSLTVQPPLSLGLGESSAEGLPLSLSLLPSNNATHTINSTLDQLVEQFHSLHKASDPPPLHSGAAAGGAGSNGTGTGTNTGSGTGMGVGPDGKASAGAARDVKAVVYLPDLTLRYVLLAPPLNRQLNDLLVRFAGAGVKIKYPFRDRNDPHAALLVEGEAGLIQQATQTINDLVSRSAQSLQAATLLLSDEQHRLLVASDLAGVKYVQGQAGVHLKLEPAHYETAKALCVFDMRRFYKPRTAAANAAGPGPTNALLLASAPPAEDEEVLAVRLQRRGPADGPAAGVEVCVLRANCPPARYLSAVQALAYVPPPPRTSEEVQGEEVQGGGSEGVVHHAHWQRPVLRLPRPPRGEEAFDRPDAGDAKAGDDAPAPAPGAGAGARWTQWAEAVRQALDQLAAPRALQAVALWLPRGPAGAGAGAAEDAAARAAVDAVLALAAGPACTLQRVWLIDCDADVLARWLDPRDRPDAAPSATSSATTSSTTSSSTSSSVEAEGGHDGGAGDKAASPREGSSPSEGQGGGPEPEGPEASPAPQSDAAAALAALSPDAHSAAVRRLLQHADWQASPASTSSPTSSPPPSLRLGTCNVCLPPASALVASLQSSESGPSRAKAVLVKGLPQGIALAVELLDVVSQQRQPQLFLVKSAAPPPINTVSSSASCLAAATLPRAAALAPAPAALPALSAHTAHAAPAAGARAAGLRPEALPRYDVYGAGPGPAGEGAGPPYAYHAGPGLSGLLGTSSGVQPWRHERLSPMDGHPAGPLLRQDPPALHAPLYGLPGAAAASAGPGPGPRGRYASDGPGLGLGVGMGPGGAYLLHGPGPAGGGGASAAYRYPGPVHGPPPHASRTHAMAAGHTATAAYGAFRGGQAFSAGGRRA